MATLFQQSSLKEFITEYQSGLKKTAPVKTGRLRDSILVLYPTIALKYHIDTVAVDYAIYANNKHHFVEKNDFRIEEFASEFQEDIWDAFFEQNKTPNK